MTPKEYIALVREYSPELPPQDLLSPITVVETTKHFDGHPYPWDDHDGFRDEVCVELYKLYFPLKEM